MRIFVTGASGFLGRRVIRRLSNENHTVLALTRKKEQAERFHELNITPVRGSLEKIRDWAEALSGVDIMIHLAALIDTWGSWETFYRNITESTLQLVQEAELRGVKRFIYISSESVLQDGKPLLDIDENHPYPAIPSSFYGRAKMLAEQAIMRQNGRMESIILRPTFIWGEDSKQILDMITRAKKGKLPRMDKGESMFEHVHVENVADAIVKALTLGRNKQIYFITNEEPMPVKQFFEQLLRAAGAPVPRASLPSRPLYRIARWMETLWPLLDVKGRPPFTRFEIEFLSLPRRYNIEKAKRELQYKPTVTFQQGVSLFSKYE